MTKNISKPSDAIRRRVLAHSGNQCAFPGCSKPIFIENEMKGHIAHIKARKPKGPRYDPNQTPGERNGFENLIAVCKEHGTHIDDNNQVDTYTVAFLQRIKKEHEEKIEQNADRNWILPPNSITGGTLGGSTVHYWVDRNGKPRVYSDEQLAKCSVLLQLSIDISNLNTTLTALRSLEEPIVKSLFEQSYAKVGENSDNLYAHIVQLMAIVPEATFGEFMRFIVDGNDATPLIDNGTKRLKNIVDGNESSFWRQK